MDIDYIESDIKHWVTQKKEPFFIEGIKSDSGKLRFDLIPADALEEVTKVFTFGAKKYGDRNWEKGLSYGRLFGAMMRHAWSWWKGESYDSEAKCHHLSSVIFSALALLHYELNLEKFGKFDDRTNVPTKVSSIRLKCYKFISKWIPFR